MLYYSGFTRRIGGNIIENHSAAELKPSTVVFLETDTMLQMLMKAAL